MSRKIFLAVICVASIAILATGCMTTTQKGTAVGSGTGAAVGAGIGALTGDPAMGAAIGASVGAVGGALVGDHMDKKREAAEKAELERQLEMERQSGSSQGRRWIEAHTVIEPKKTWIDTSKMEKVYVDEHMEGDKRIEGHYEERLIKSGYWDEYEIKIDVPGHFE